jgi:hypothetical protein
MKGKCLSPGRGAKDVGISNWRVDCNLQTSVTTVAGSTSEIVVREAGARSFLHARPGRLTILECRFNRTVLDTALVNIGVAQLPVAAHVPEVVAAELVGAGNVDDQMPIGTNVGILDEEVSATHLAVGLPHRGNVVARCGQARFMADLLQGIQDRLVGILRASSVLPAGVDVITITQRRVDDVLMARADEGRRRLLYSLT